MHYVDTGIFLLLARADSPAGASLAGTLSACAVVLALAACALVRGMMAVDRRYAGPWEIDPTNPFVLRGQS